MGVFAVDHSNASPVTSVEEMAGKFYGELIGQIPRWRERLRRSPDQLEHVEHEVRDAFGRGASSSLSCKTSPSMRCLTTAMRRTMCRLLWQPWGLGRRSASRCIKNTGRCCVTASGGESSTS